MENTSSNTKIVIADPNKEFRKQCASEMRKFDISVLAEAGDAEEALGKIVRLKPGHSCLGGVSGQVRLSLAHEVGQASDA